MTPDAISLDIDFQSRPPHNTTTIIEKIYFNIYEKKLQLNDSGYASIPETVKYEYLHILYEYKKVPERNFDLDEIFRPWKIKFPAKSIPYQLSSKIKSLAIISKKINNKSMEDIDYTNYNKLITEIKGLLLS
jgi:hypothetical protein